MPTILISAGEVSGDIHASHLVRAIKSKRPDINFIGIGGDRMREVGVKTVMDICSVSTVGLVEPIRYLPRIYKAYRALLKLIKTEKPDMFIPVDSQGFHMLVLHKIRKYMFPKVYYISPQEWHWGTEKGGLKVVALVDKILAIFPQEADFYNELGNKAVYVGHPLLDTVKATMDKQTFCETHGLDPKVPILSIFPGSRRQELQRTAPPLFKAAALIQKEIPGCQVVVYCVADEFKQRVEELMKMSRIQTPFLYRGNSHDLIGATTLSLVSSGTISLEHAILGTPCIVAYKLSPITYRFAHMFLKKQVEKIVYISLPNIILDKWVIPEFIQENADFEKIGRCGIELLNSEEKLSEFIEALKEVKEKLGGGGAVTRASDEVVRMIKA